MLKQNKPCCTIAISIILLLSLVVRSISYLLNLNLKYNITYSYSQDNTEIRRYSRQAFLFLDSIDLDISKRKNRSISQEIIIIGIDNHILKKRILRILKINEIFTQVIFEQDLILLVSKLKLSGFFTNVQTYQVNFHRRQIIYIKVSVNPVLKQISINRYSQKIIPYAYLLFIFRNQVGYPVNFDNIDICLNLITQWYHSRGYQWAVIKLLESQLMSSGILVDIQEGIISKIEFVNLKEDVALLHKENIFPISLLLEIMQIFPLEILNINNLEKGILKLKTQRVISQCHYKISLSKETQDHLSIVLKVKMSNQRSTYLLHKNISIDRYCIHSLESLLKYSLHNIVNNSYNYRLLQQRLCLLTVKYFTDLVNQSHILYAKICNTDNYFKQFVKYKFFDKNQFLCDWHKAQFILMIADYLGIKHYVQNLFRPNSSFFLIYIVLE